MASNDLYILPDEVQLFPVKDLPIAATSKFEFDGDDFMITYSKARNTSKVIDASSALLLKEFRKPKSLPEGVFTYANLNNLNAEETLEDAYGFLSRLRSEGFLVLYNDAFLKKENKVLKPGDTFNAYEIVSKLQGVTDTELYKVKQNNTFYALKILKTNGRQSVLSKSFHNEIEVLKTLDNCINPKLIEHGEFDNDLFLVMDWVDGMHCNEVALKYNNLADPQTLFESINFCCNILKVYSHLHHQGIIHSDIHPRNILVQENGDIRLVDFGLAKIISSPKQPPRGGVGFFYEPEYATAIIQKNPPPVSSLAGEQYALATLMYQLITGKQYVDFSFDSDKLYYQIANDSPISFSAYDLDIPPAIEKVIFKALAKKPEDRYMSIDEFHEALSATKNGLLNQSNSDTKISAQLYCESLKEQYGFEGNLIENGLQLAPNCSVNFGAAGIAYLFYRMALVESNPELLTIADVWADRANGFVHHSEKGFYSKEIDITPAIVGETSIYHTASGVHLVQALIAKENCDYSTYLNAAQQFIFSSDKACNNLDLTLGKSATLIGCSLLFENMLPFDATIQQGLLSLGKQTMGEIWGKIDTYPVMAEANPISYRGIAHGWAGILYATLKWCNVSKQALPTHFFNRIDQLLSLGIEEDEYIRWAVSNNDNTSWTGWCHGSAGYTFLWTLLYRFTKDKKYLQAAEKAVQHFLKFGEGVTNGSLCCGIAGECYALLNVYNVTHNDYYLTEAKRLAKKMLPHIYTGQMRNHSLYKGNIGAGVLLAELAQPQFAKMPLFE